MAGTRNIIHGEGGQGDALSSIPSTLCWGRPGQISRVSVTSAPAHGPRAGPYARAPIVLPGQCDGDYCGGPSAPYNAHRPTGLWCGGPLPLPPPWHDRPSRQEDVSPASTVG